VTDKKIRMMPWTRKYRHAQAVAGALVRACARLFFEEGASTPVIFALTLPVMVAAGGGAVDYGMASMTAVRMKSVADSAALAASRELQLAQMDASKVTVIANNVINGSIQDVSSQVNVDFSAMTVQVVIQKTYSPIFSNWLTTHLEVSSVAKMSGAMPLCMLGLNPSAPDTINLEQSALMTAPGCLVQSNSSDKRGLAARHSAVLTAGLICSAGGKSQSSSANFSPQPTTDCPVLPDPLSSRVAPAVGPCNFTDVVINGGSANLQPGVYCGGLKLTNGAVAALSKGIFIIKDGPLTVDAGATVSGTEVAIFLTGNTANLTFDADSIVDLSAPKDGPLAGILIFDDPSGAPAPALKPKSGRGAAGRKLKNGAPRQHQIFSDNARNLLGTIYMPMGEIIVDAEKPIADKSAYTVLVVNQLHLYSGPNLVLNPDYSATEVPVPQGVGPYGAKIFLSN
jgi:putative Flp pilus-assembly TadE/G-like protein